MTPEEHAKELTRLKSLATRATTKMKTHTGTLAAKLALRAAADRALAAVREHKLAYYALTEGSRTGPVLTQAEAKMIAHWVCSHDTGVQPAGEAVQRPTGWVVVVRSHEVTAAGAINVVTQEAWDYAGARAILGY